MAKSWDRHVEDALRTSLEEGVAMVAESVAFLREHGLRVFVDAEHFFDGYRHNRDFVLRVLDAAESAGAEALVLCDTNGGSLPDEIGGAVADVRERSSAELGIHCHNDAGCAVANSLVAVEAGVTQVQGCINGYGERAGNTDLSATIPNLSLKLQHPDDPGRPVGAADAGGPPHRRARQPRAGPAAAVRRDVGLRPQGRAAHQRRRAERRDLYEHISPELVGNGTRVVVSEMAGRSTLAMKAAELGLELDGEVLGRVLDELKQLEHEGYHFEVADGSLELLLRRAAGWEPDFFSVESFRVITDHGRAAAALDETRLGDRGADDGGDGEGPRRRATAWWRRPRATGRSTRSTPRSARPSGRTSRRWPAIHLVDYRVRVLDTGKGTGAVTRVLVDTADGERTWTTIGVSENIIEASWQALYDSIVFALVHVRPVVSAPMTQPSFVPIAEADQVRPSLRLEVPGGWTTDRPAELQIPIRPAGRSMGTPGSDQGFALRLARAVRGPAPAGAGRVARRTSSSAWPWWPPGGRACWAGRRACTTSGRR